LLRALGAGRAQVVRSVVLEALLIGVVASVAGLAGGIAVAGLLKAMFDAFGFALPAGGLTISATSMIVPLVTGTVVTVGASLAPALRASRVPPLAAMRAVAVDDSGAAPVRAVVGGVLLVAGVALTVVGAVGDAGLAFAGLGALVTLVGVVVFGPVVARAASGAIGAPVRRWRGVTGALARENARRSPRRTAGTASALMVGVAVVTLFTVFAASLKTSINNAVERSFAGDLAVTTGAFGSALSPQLATELAALPDVSAAAGLGRGVARIGGQDESVTVADPAPLSKVLDLDVEAGALESLGADGLAVSSSTADRHHWTVGREVPVTFTDGTTTDLRVGAIFGEDDLTGAYVLPRAAWAPHAVQDLDSAVYVALADGVPLAQGKAAVEQVAGRYGGPDVLDRAGYVAESTSRINIVLGLVYVMLALAVVIALLGIANTLSLSILERTRELGVLRAIGATRARLRSMVRWESVIIALFGTIGGLGVGLFLGWALTAVALDVGGGAFTAPIGSLAVVLVAGGLAGVLAAVRPARRAGRLDVLAAIATE
jgi:putative ABC transport system permease protein